MQTINSRFRYLSLLFFSFFTIQLSAQTGLNFQGVARANNNVIIASQPITLKLSILQGTATGNAEYVETRRVTTNAQGLFTVVIGDTGAISTIGDFASISWRNTPKFLKIEMDPTAGNNFITMGTTQFQYVAYASFAKSVDAENIVGIIPVTLGGTGVNSLSNLKTALSIDKINNTADLSKPISTLTQAALDLKLNAVDTNKFIKQTYLDSALLSKLNSTAVVATATNALTATNATTAISATTAITATYAILAGTASTATQLATARNINGVAFDGSGDISITTIVDAGTLTGTTLKSNVTGSSLTSVGALTAGSVPYSLLSGTVPIWNQNTTGNAASATTAITATTAASAISATTAITATTAISALSAATATIAGNITATTNASLTSLPNLTSIGSITSGVWSATTIPVSKGGTGVTSLTGILKGSGTNALSIAIAGTDYQAPLLLTTAGTGAATLSGTTLNIPIQASGGSSTYSIGLNADLGGYVFFITPDAKHGLVAAAQDQGSYVTWFNSHDEISNPNNYDVNGKKFTDWRLPYKYELNLIYLLKSNIGGFATMNYWSATESDTNYGWLQSFVTGIQNYNNKTGPVSIRAIRAF